MHSHKRKHERRNRMMEYETGRHFMRSIRPKMKLPLPRVNPTYRSLHGNPQLPIGEKPLLMPPCPAIIFKSDPGAASIAERAALAGQSAALGVSQTSPLAGQMMSHPVHSIASASRPDIQAVQPSVITSAPSSLCSSFESSGSRSAFDLVRDHAPEDRHRSTPVHSATTSVITNTSAAAAATADYQHSSDDSMDERPMNLQVYSKPPTSEPDSNDEDKPTDLSMHDKPSASRDDEDLPSGFAKIAEMGEDKEGEDLNDSLNLPIASFISPPGGMHGEDVAEAPRSPPSPVYVKKEPQDVEVRQEEAWQKYFRRWVSPEGIAYCLVTHSGLVPSIAGLGSM